MIAATVGTVTTLIVKVAAVDPQLLVNVYDITVVPVESPVTNPEFTVATDVLLLLQVPPKEVSVNDVVAPTHTELAPPIAAGAVGTVFTVMVVVAAVEPQKLETV